MQKNILKKALVSEKSFHEAVSSKFTFHVSSNANKESVALSCKELFGVDVLKVNIVNTPGKVKKTKKGEGRRSDQKKAIVTVKKGQKIDLFDIEEDSKKDKKKDEKKQRIGVAEKP